MHSVYVFLYICHQYYIALACFQKHDFDRPYAFNYVCPSNEGRHIVLVWFFLPLLLLLSEACADHNFFLSFRIGQLYLVCGCMTIRQCVAYRNDLRGTLTFDLKVKSLFFKYYFLVRAITFLSFEISQWYLVCGCITIRRCVMYRNDLHGTLTFDLKVK
jgi:hypothetical protein